MFTSLNSNDFSQANWQVTILSNAFAANDIDISIRIIRDAVALMHCHKDWQSLSSQEMPQKQVPWIKMDSISASLRAGYSKRAIVDELDILTKRQTRIDLNKDRKRFDDS